MDTTVIHIFFIITTIAGRPIVGDLYEHTFSTMQECAAYVEDNKKEIAEAVEEIRPFISVPDGVPFEVAYGCRGKESI
jgi:hypothetical protein